MEQYERCQGERASNAGRSRQPWQQPSPPSTCSATASAPGSAPPRRLLALRDERLLRTHRRAARRRRACVPTPLALARPPRVLGRARPRRRPSAQSWNAGSSQRTQRLSLSVNIGSHGGATCRRRRLGLPARRGRGWRFVQAAGDWRWSWPRCRTAGRRSARLPDVARAMASPLRPHAAEDTERRGEREV